jgi:uncharacterized protein YrrD
MIRLTQLIGQPVVALGSAEKIGSVSGAVVRNGRVVAVTSGDHVIPAESIPSFDGDALTFDHQVVDDDLSRSASRIVGHPVLTTAGDGLGPLVDLELDGAGVVQAVELPSGTLPGTRLRTIGSYAAIVTEDDPGPLPPPSPAR